MTVYVVKACEQWEGFSIIGIFTSMKGARGKVWEYAEGYCDEMEGYYRPAEFVDEPQATDDFIDNDVNHYIRIDEMEVQK